MNSINIKVSDKVIPMYQPILKDVLQHKHTHYIGKGGRGSTKSSFYGGLCIPLLIMSNPNVHAVCVRKIANTVQKSIFAQVIWGIYALGVESLFDIPKSYSTPIKYKSTGQQIIFSGLDDPQKMKSIKVPFGYIGITWWEELDQYTGPQEIRTALQSTMRGGDKFWNFYTFNPPISINNWANEFAEQYKDRDDTMVTSNTYLDVPDHWLGQAFIDEALFLKSINENAYRHEYLGIPVGTGGGVFPNACEWDSTQLVDCEWDDNGNPVSQCQAWEAFDRDSVYNGLDWGFAVDPNSYVKCYFDSKKYDLYIYKEYRSKGERNIDIFNSLYKEKKLITDRELLIADSAEQKSILDFKTYGAHIKPADKGPESVRQGIKWLQTLNHIYIDRKTCPHTYKEFMHYEYDKDKDGNWISRYPDKDNHSIDATRYALEKFWKRRGN